MADGDSVFQLSTVGTFFCIWTWHMYFVDIDFSKTDNDIFAYCPHSSLKQGNKEQNSVMIEMHIVLMTEYVYILYS